MTNQQDDNVKGPFSREDKGAGDQALKNLNTDFAAVTRNRLRRRRRLCANMPHSIAQAQENAQHCAIMRA